MTSKPFIVGLIQMRCSADKQANLDKAEAMLREAAKRGAKISCLPELFTSLYFCQEENADLFNLAEPLEGETTQRLAKIAKDTKMSIVGSIFERRTAGVYHNTAVILNEKGELAGVYRKMHIPDDPLFLEKYYFTPGDIGFKSHDVECAKVGTLVCWDQWYPEAARLTAMQGAEILFYPTAIGWHPKEKDEYGEAQRSMWETIQRSHAIANGLFVAAVNRIGHEGAAGGGLEFWGNSFLADPYGRIIALGSVDKEEVITAEVDPALIESTRRNWPFFRDRRIDYYGGLTSRFGNP